MRISFRWLMGLVAATAVTLVLYSYFGAPYWLVYFIRSLVRHMAGH